MMPDDSDSERLKALIRKLAKAQESPERPPRPGDHHAAAAQGWRMVMELVAGIGIGVAVGLGLDTLFGSMPLFLVMFVLLGFAAGVLTMLRTARELQGQVPPKDEGN